MRKTKTVSDRSMQAQLKDLQTRVSGLERALSMNSKQPADPEVAGQVRDATKQDARRRALKDYYEARRIERYRENPNLVAISLKMDREKNEFLKSQGLEPEPSDLPPDLIQKARNAAVAEYQQLQKKELLDSRAKFEAFMRERGCRRSSNGIRTRNLRTS